jgi:Uncharacterized protein conserved in bacteria (DUF2188)
MAKHDELIIVPRENGQWAVEKPHAERASSIEDSLKNAIAYATEHAPEGDIKIKGLDGKFAHIQKAAK